jgi:hypothetical protein
VKASRTEIHPKAAWSAEHEAQTASALTSSVIAAARAASMFVSVHLNSFHDGSKIYLRSILARAMLYFFDALLMSV